MTLFLLALACGPKSAPVSTPTSTASTETAATDTAESLWSERGDKAKLQASLDRYAQVLTTDASNRDALYHLTRGWYFLGDGHETEKDAKLAVWATALSYGDKCLAMNTEYAGLLAKGDEDPASASRAFTKDDVPCIYWYASALGKWAKMSGLTVTLKHLPTVKAFMTKLGELDPDYYYSGHDRYWGAYYAAIPSFAGQDLNKSKEYFDKALAAYPNFLGTHVLLAEQWAVKTQNKQVFLDELNWVLAQDPNGIPEVRPEAEAEQRKAKALLAEIDSFFAN
jgi:tetratricopeptide (TPR) repeat protein